MALTDDTHRKYSISLKKYQIIVSFDTKKLHDQTYLQ